MNLACRIGLAAALFLGTAECSARFVPPRAQVIADDLPGLVVRDGQPFWSVPGEFTDLLTNTACATTAAHDVLFVGDSVLYVTGDDRLPMPEAERAAANFSRRLQAAHPDWCVRNPSQPGWQPVQQLFAVDDALAVHTPDLVVLGVWKDDRRFHAAAGRWFDLTPYTVDGAGLPFIPGLPLPAQVAGPLFAHSALYRALTLTLGGTVAREVDARSLLDAARRLRARGVPVALLEATRLDGPLDKARRPPWMPKMEADAEAEGIPYLRLAELLAGQDVATLRIDTCCHYDFAGHTAIADALDPILTSLLTTGSAARPSPSPPDAPAAPTPAPATPSAPPTPSPG